MDLKVILNVSTAQENGLSSFYHPAQQIKESKISITQRTVQLWKQGSKSKHIRDKSSSDIGRNSIKVKNSNESMKKKLKRTVSRLIVKKEKKSIRT